MTPARLQRIEEIFYAALDQEPDQIHAFLDTTCEGDELLRRKVEALLASRGQAGSFIETSAAGIATRIIGNGRTDLLVGQTFGHYKISKRIGSGGMGEVYLATDVTAGRKAALKLLPARFTGDAERLRRFRQEARAVVALNHPNILTVYEIGEDHSTHYIASELIEGETLHQRLKRGHLQVSEAVDVAIQVASALAVAHEAGIIHRDIKPENIMLRPDGYVKVLDFGVAKLAQQEAPTAMPKDEALLLVETNLGSVLGTVRYMSPEQTCGAPVDKRTDIWSLGIVFYEMLTGHTPFTGDTPQEVMTSILEMEPPPLTSYVKQTPAELQQIISKTLRKDREERYQNAHELLEALKDIRRKLEFEAELERSPSAPLWLRWARSATALVLVLLVAALALALPFYWHRNLTTNSPPEKSIAVLPFENLSTDPENTFFAEGIQEEILARLAKIGELKVISRTSTQQYQSKPGNLSEIARQLGVGNILKGSVQKAGDHVRVNVQLINAATGSQLRADSYDRKLTDIFGVESEIAKGIARSLQAKLTGREEQALAVKPTSNPAAYDAYLRGLAFDARSSWYNDNTGEKAVASYEKAVQLDPTFALAWARLSYSTAFSYFGRGSTTATPAAAKRALENAQKLQPDSLETLLALAYYQYWVLRDYALAKSTFRLVSKMSPGSEVLSGLAFIARREGQWDESITYLEQALVLDPRNTELLVNVAFTYCMLRQFPTALKLYDRGLDIFPNDPALLAAKAAVYQAQGDLEEAAKWLPEINVQTSLNLVFSVNNAQSRIKRNLGEAIRLLQARQAQFHFESEFEKAVNQMTLALDQRLAGDSSGEKVNAEQARDAVEPLCKSQRDNFVYAKVLSQAYAALGNKDAALKEAERATTLLPSDKDAMSGPSFEENLAIIEMIIGENGRAISILAQLLAKPYQGEYYLTPITPALLRLDPLWDTLRADPAFQKLCEEKPH
jgi:serine/threonine protein kinase/Tfp pilus assembly protein PilF